MRFPVFPALPMDRGTGRRKRKTPLSPKRDIRGDVIAVPLSFLACRTGNEVHSGGITRRAPGRTSRLPAAGPLSAGEGPSLFFGANATLPFTAPYRALYYHPLPAVSSLEKNFGGFPRCNLGLTGFYPGFLAKRGEGLYDEREFWGSFRRPTGGGYSKIAAGAVPQPRLALPSRCLLVRDRRAGLGPVPTKGQDASASAVGAGVLTRPPDFGAAPPYS